MGQKCLATLLSSRRSCVRSDKPRRNSSRRVYAPTVAYLSSISWDPTTAEYWPLLAPKLDAKELGLFQKNGFVVSQRLGGPSFADVYYDLYQNDLPVFVSTDALLQAWHRSFVSMLEELEEAWFSVSLRQMLDGMYLLLPTTRDQFGAGALQDSVMDADYYLAVGRSLLSGSRVPPPSDRTSAWPRHSTTSTRGSWRRSDYSANAV